MYLPQETLGLRRQGFSPCFSLLKPAYALPRVPQPVTELLHHPRNARLPRLRVRGFGAMLIPDYYRRQTPRPVSYYALFKWWLLLSQHPGCHGTLTSFRTETSLGTLDGGLGCFPLDDEDYPPPSDSRERDLWYSEFGWSGYPGRAPAPASSSTPKGFNTRLAQKLFRGERDISRYD